MPNFNNNERAIVGWYWALRTKELSVGRTKAIKMLGKDFVFYRTDEGQVVALDAYCPHMGAHLAEGTVEGNSVRCLFHRWKFDAAGECTDVPFFNGAPPFRVCTRRWPATEAYGLIWLWNSQDTPGPLPIPAELEQCGFETQLGASFGKNCHPHVVLVNAIDEHHFNGVHHLPVKLWMQSRVLSDAAISFENQTRLGNTTWLKRFLSRFYKGPLTYQLTYWYGTTGAVTLGPDFQHFYIVFTLRPTDDGRTEGQTLLFTRRKPGPAGWMLSRILLLTSVIGNYFARGDTKIFRSIRFSLKTPIKADHAILDFIRHIDHQRIGNWNEAKISNREILNV